MAVLKYRENFKRFPEYSDAIAALRPDSSFGISMNDYSSLYWQDTNATLAPSEEEIKSKLQELIAEWEVEEYRRQRYLQYPCIEEQLALLWDDMDAGKIPGKETSEWFAKVKEVKENIPKGSLGPDNTFEAARYAWNGGIGAWTLQDGEVVPVQPAPTGPVTE